MVRSEPGSREEQARRRAAFQSGLFWYAAVFLVVNGLLWFLDLRVGGLEWAYWLTIFWGIGLFFHAAAYVIDERERRTYRRSFKEEEEGDRSVK